MAMYNNHVPYEEREYNNHIIREIAEDMDMTIIQVEDITKHFSNFIGTTIHSGGLEGIMIPYLGKFQVKLHSQQYKDYLHAIGREMKGYFKKNAEAMNIIKDTYETPET